ncbi:MAG: DUF3833 family protein [Alphaproteobacteria bacterium]|nr:DUF3833 family protein [Alphaproteobacteria bacterium]
MNLDVKRLNDMSCRPERFFLGRCNGAGVIRSPFGGLIRRFTVSTTGTVETGYGAVQVVHTFVFDNGDIEVMKWLVTDGQAGAYMFYDRHASAGLTVNETGEDFRYHFHTTLRGLPKWIKPRFDGCMTLLAPESLIAVVKVSLLGAPLGTMTAVHRRQGV